MIMPPVEKLAVLIIPFRVQLMSNPIKSQIQLNIMLIIEIISALEMIVLIG